MASDRHLVFVLRQFATTQKGQKEWLVVFIAVCRCAKFGWDYQRTCEDVSFNVMGFGLKMPFHVPFFGLFGVKMGTAELLTVLFVYECNNLGLTSNESNSVKLVLRFSLWRKQKLG